MNKALAAVIGLMAIVAYGIWFEFFHPLSYTQYRNWVADCPANSERAKRAQASPLPDCAISYGNWKSWVEQGAAAANQQRR